MASVANSFRSSPPQSWSFHLVPIQAIPEGIVYPDFRFLHIPGPSSPSATLPSPSSSSPSLPEEPFSPQNDPQDLFFDAVETKFSPCQRALLVSMYFFKEGSFLVFFFPLVFPKGGLSFLSSRITLICFFFMLIVPLDF